MSDNRPTIVIRLPTGWARAAVAGIEAALLGWLIPAIVGVSLFWQLATNPWLREVGWESGGLAGGNFWSLSLGGSAPLGEIAVQGWPLLWSIMQIVITRVLLLQSRSVSPAANWAVVPTFALTSLFLVLTATTGAVWRTFLGALAVSILAALWAHLGALRRERRKDAAGPGLAAARRRRWRWVGDGFRLGGLWLLAVAGVSLVLVGVTTVVNWGQISDSYGLLGEGAGALRLVFLMFGPNLLGWAWSWLVGAGVMGPGGQTVTVASPRQEDFVLPYWYMLPQTPGPGWLLWVPVALGLVLGGIVAYRRRNHRLVANLRPVGVGLVTLLLGVLGFTALSGFSLGSERLAYLGPIIWPALGWTALKVALPLLAVVLVAHRETFDAAKRLFQWTQRAIKALRARLAARTTKTEDQPAPANIEQSPPVEEPENE